MAPQVPVGGEREVRGGGRAEGERRVGSDHSAGAYCPQTNTSCTYGQTPMQIEARGHPDVSTHVWAHAWPPVSLGLGKQNLAPLKSYPGSAMSVVSKKKADRETTSVLVSLQVNLQPKEEVEKGEEVDEERMLSVNWQGDKDSVISAYTSQNNANMSASHSDQSDALLGDYGVMRAAPRKDREEKYFDDEGRTLWVCKTRKVVLPKMDIEVDGWVDEPLLLKRGIREDEEYVTRCRLRLEDVFVRQASEEEAAQKESENSEEMRSKEEDIFNKWGLKIPMD